MPETPERLVERLRSEGQKTEAFFSALEPEQWKVRLYVDGSQWTVAQLLAHFVSAEIGNRALIEQIWQGGSGAPPDFDIDAFNERQVAGMAVDAPQALLAEFTRRRQATIDLVAGMTPEDLQKVGRNPFLGEAPLEEIIKLVYRHNQIHQRDVRRVLAEAGAPAG